MLKMGDWYWGALEALCTWENKLPNRKQSQQPLRKAQVEKLCGVSTAG